MEQSDRMHAHPKDKFNMFWGFRLEPGDIICAGVYYANETNGKWEKVPEKWFNLNVEKWDKAYYVRMN